jgi:PAS domain-containing protein
MDDFKFLEIIELMPGYVSAIDLNLRYIAVNPGLRKFASEKTLNGQTIDCEVGCEGLPQRMKGLINAPVGTEDKWIYKQERYLKTQTLMVVSKKFEWGILNVATDITEIKSNEERLFNILNYLPSALALSNERNDLKALILALNLSVSGEKPQNTSAVEREVLLKQALVKYSQLERDIFIDPHGLMARLNKLEVCQSNDDEAWGKFTENRDEIQKLASLAQFFNNIPGGKKTIIIIIIMINITAAVVVNAVVKYWGISQFIPSEIKELIK